MTILNIEQVVTQYHWGWSWAGFIFGLLAMFCFCIGVIIELDDGPGLFLFLACIVWAIFAFTIFSQAGPKNVVNQYEIICDKDFEYSQDYIESHTFIEKRGDIWVWQDNEKEVINEDTEH